MDLSPLNNTVCKCKFAKNNCEITTYLYISKAVYCTRFLDQCQNQLDIDANKVVEFRNSVGAKKHGIFLITCQIFLDRRLSWPLIPCYENWILSNCNFKVDLVPAYFNIACGWCRMYLLWNCCHKQISSLFVTRHSISYIKSLIRQPFLETVARLSGWCPDGNETPGRFVHLGFS